MDADKLKDLTSVKANKNKPSARPKQAATGDYSQLYPGQQQAIDKLSDLSLIHISEPTRH